MEMLEFPIRPRSKLSVRDFGNLINFSDAIFIIGTGTELTDE
jgi:hypothetical protein